MKKEQLSEHLDEFINQFIDVAEGFYLKLEAVDLTSLEFISSDEESGRPDNGGPFVGRLLLLIPTIRYSYFLGDGTPIEKQITFDIPFNRCGDYNFISGIIYNALCSVVIGK